MDGTTDWELDISKLRKCMVQLQNLECTFLFFMCPVSGQPAAASWYRHPSANTLNQISWTHPVTALKYKDEILQLYFFPLFDCQIDIFHQGIIKLIKKLKDYQNINLREICIHRIQTMKSRSRKQLSKILMRPYMQCRFLLLIWY